MNASLIHVEMVQRVSMNLTIINVCALLALMAEIVIMMWMNVLCLRTVN